jgi:chloride channel protein, CIC family
MTGGPSPAPPRAERLGDFSVERRTLLIAAWAIPVGAAGAGAAFCLLRLIGLITNLVFEHRVSTALVNPGTGHHSALLVLLAPIVGGLIVGLMARYGSERIRGHGMPESIEAILTKGSRVQPRVAVLKPVSAAISIGTGGPFGAEGPIIMTGGAVGSIIAQLLELSAAERKTLLVAGAGAGMTAVFDSPMAAVLLAIEVLLFEFKPRSLVPVAAAVITSFLLRPVLISSHALFPVPNAALHLTAGDQLLCIAVGATGGVLALVATYLIYTSEDLFERLPIHWMWWPAIGGLIIGAGGLVEPRALGVGYDVIGALLTGHATLSLIVGILVVKTLIWSLSLGSGTSGGVLAPTFMIGAALGALEGHVLPGVSPGFWALVGLAACVGGVIRAPLTGIVFPLELTHEWRLLVPCLIGSTAAYLLSALLLRRSVLTERLARRGYHLSQEYATDPLELLLVAEVMHGEPVVAAGEEPAGALAARADLHEQWLFPVRGDAGGLVGVIPRNTLVALDGDAERPARQLAERPRVLARPDETLRELARRMGQAQVTTAVVVDREDPERIVGLVTVQDLLQAHLRDEQWETDRERTLRPWVPVGRLRGRRQSAG